jgi:hypothetical protein
MVSRRNVHESKFVRVAEAWFVAPQDGDYIFYAACDDQCWLDFSTTEMDKSAATQILYSSYSDWRYFVNPANHQKSSPVTLEKNKHYYMKMTHQDSGNSDHFTIGFKIDDNSTDVENAESTWKRLAIDPHHVFEKYEVKIKKDDSVKYSLQFKNTNTDYNLT